jgi:hypothetical protein
MITEKWISNDIVPIANIKEMKKRILPAMSAWKNLLIYIPQNQQNGSEKENEDVSF